MENKTEETNLESLSHLELIIKEGDHWMTSLQLSEISGRDHKNVLRDIERDILNKKKKLRNMIKRNNDDTFITPGLKFEPSFKEILSKSMNNMKVVEDVYYDKSNKRSKMYLLNRDASLICLTRYNFEIQVFVNHLFLEYIDRERNELKIKGDKYDILTKSSGTISIGTAAKIIKAKNLEGKPIGRNKLFEILRERGILQHEKGSYNIPYQLMITSGMFKIVSKVSEKEKFYAVVRVTPQGLDMITNLLSELGYKFDEDIDTISVFRTDDEKAIY